MPSKDGRPALLWTFINYYYQSREARLVSPERRSLLSRSAGPTGAFKTDKYGRNGKKGKDKRGRVLIKKKIKILTEDLKKKTTIP